MSKRLEKAACTPHPIHNDGFNPRAELPYGLPVEQLGNALLAFNEFLGFINQQLFTREVPRLESLLMPANFSSMVGEFMSASIPKYCSSLVKNNYHNGHPDLIPTGSFPNNAVQHVNEGIEIKASRYKARWQGHNPEDIWLMVFVFDSNRPADIAKGTQPRPFRFNMVVGARLTRDDWVFAGRSATSRRTITASVTTAASARMVENWIYRDTCGQTGKSKPVLVSA